MTDIEAKAPRIRHPEKAHKPDQEVKRKPAWIRVKAPVSREYHATREIVKAHKLHTVCEDAACPNIGECWAQRHATMMIMGDTCTRACSFCHRSEEHTPELQSLMRSPYAVFRMKQNTRNTTTRLRSSGGRTIMKI